MQLNYVSSRSVVVDKCYRKAIENNYDQHKRKLDAIKNRRSDFGTYEQEHELLVKKKLEQKSKV